MLLTKKGAPVDGWYLKWIKVICLHNSPGSFVLEMIS